MLAVDFRTLSHTEELFSYQYMILYRYCIHTGGGRRVCPVDFSIFRPIIITGNFTSCDDGLKSIVVIYDIAHGTRTDLKIVYTSTCYRRIVFYILKKKTPFAYDNNNNNNAAYGDENALTRNALL